jgi:transcriptional regulator with XRE-family HTH domain
VEGVKISAITRFKHGALWGALKRLNWTQTDLAKKCGVSIGTISRIMLLKERPSQRLADVLQSVLGGAGVYIDVTQEWPESFRGLPHGAVVEQTRDIDASQLDAYRCFYDSLEKEAVNEDRLLMRDRVRAALNTLDDREKQVIVARFGLDADTPMTLEDTGRKFRVTRERVRQMEAKAIRKLRHPRRMAIIKEGAKSK